MEEKKDYITVIDENGNEKQAEVLLYFRLEETNKEYLVYTFNEEAGNDLVVVHTSVVLKTEDGKHTLKAVETDEEWSKIKDIMREVIKENEE